MNEIKGTFVFVNKGATKLFQEDLEKDPKKYHDKIVFIEETRQIYTHGVYF